MFGFFKKKKAVKQVEEKSKQDIGGYKFKSLIDFEKKLNIDAQKVYNNKEYAVYHKLSSNKDGIRKFYLDHMKNDYSIDNLDIPVICLYIDEISSFIPVDDMKTQAITISYKIAKKQIERNEANKFINELNTLFGLNDIFSNEMMKYIRLVIETA